MVAPKSGFAHYTRFMATLRINKVPDELHEREIERFEWRERMAKRPIVDLGPDETVAEALAEARAERDRQMDEWGRP